MMDDGRSDMVTAKCDFTCVDKCLHIIRVTCREVVKISISNVADWQVVIYLHRADPNLRALAEALLACCEEVK